MTILFIKRSIKNSLEKVGSVGKSEERYRIGHHPDVSSPAVEVRFAPFSVFIRDAEDFVVVTISVGRFVCRVRVIS